MGPRPYARARDWAAFVLMGDPGARPPLRPAYPSPTFRAAALVALGLTASMLGTIWAGRRLKAQRERAWVTGS